MLEPGYRRYLCARCRAVVKLCSRCDRGNIYCLDGCSHKSRSESLRRARRRYQATAEGRSNNAERQRRFRRRRGDVTDHGSPLRATSHSLGALAPGGCLEPPKEVVDVSLPRVPRRAPRFLRKRARVPLVVCDGCGRLCVAFARMDPLRRRRRDVLRQFGLQ